MKVENLRSFYPYSRRSFSDENNKKIDDLQNQLKNTQDKEERKELKNEIRKIYNNYKPKYTADYYIKALNMVDDYKVERADGDIECIDVYKFYSETTGWIHGNCLEEILDYAIANFGLLRGV